MKPFFVISILLILGFNHIGYYFVVQQAQEKIKEEMKAKIIAGVNEEELTLVNYTDNQQNISGEEGEENEFLYQGKMYDVVRSTVENNQIILHCISDEKETRLVEKYKSGSKDHEGIEKNQKKGGDQPVNIFVDDAIEVKHINTATAAINIVLNNCDLLTGNCTKNSPPPKA